MGDEASHDVFISYSRKDRTAVIALAEMLSERTGLRVWLDTSQLQAGESWRDEIERALNSSNTALLILGPEGLGTVQREERGLAYAVRDQRADFRVIYCLLPNTPAPRGSWANVDTWIQFQGALDEPEPFDRLIAALKGEAVPSPFVAKLPDQPAPYRGLAAFGEKDARFFYGRTRVVAEMMERLTLEPFLAVIGPSGSGKTSVVQAGLFPKLADGVHTLGAKWTRLVIRPGPHPLIALARQLARPGNALWDGFNRLKPDDSSQTVERFLVSSLETDPRNLPEQLLSVLPPEEQCLIVIDRLEELFTLCEKTTERQAFIDSFLAVVTHPEIPARIVVTMRADFYGHLAAYTDLKDEIVNHQLYLSPIGSDSIVEVIERPATDVGAVFEKRLAAQIHEDATAGREVALPLLQHALDLLWRKRSGRWLTWDVYDEFGGVDGAVRYHADQVVKALGKDREITKQLLKRLIWLDEGAGTLAGRRVEKAALIGDDADAPERDRVLQKLADQRLIVVGSETGGATAELIHDTLPVQWRQLQDWVNEDREFMLWRQRFHSSMEQWQLVGQEEGALLRGAGLSEAAHWLQERQSDLTSNERNFIEKGIRLRHRTQWFRAFAYSAIILTAIATAVTFGWLYREAEAQRKLGFSLKLAAQAELFIQTPGFPERGVLLAVESLQRAPTTEGDRALRQGLAMLPRQLEQIGPFKDVNDWVLSGDGTWLAIAEPGNGVRIWNTVTGKERFHLEPASNVSGIAFGGDGQIIATVIEGGPVQLWSFQERPQRLIRKLTPPSGGVAVALNRRGDQIATSGKDGTLHLWSLKNGAFVMQRSFGGKDRKDEQRDGNNQEKVNAFSKLTFSPDDSRLVAEAPARSAFIIDSEGSSETNIPEGREPSLWDLDNGASLGPERPPSVMQGGPYDYFISLAPVVISPDGQWMATGNLITDRDNNIRAWIWDTESGRVRTGLPHDRIVHSLAFQPRSEWLLTATDYGLLSIWDWKAGRKVNELTFGVDINGIAFDSSGHRLVLHARGGQGRHATISGSRDGSDPKKATLHIFRILQTGHAVTSLRSSPGASVRFTEDSRSLEVLQETEKGDERELVISTLDLSSNLMQKTKQTIPWFKRLGYDHEFGGRTFQIQDAEDLGEDMGVTISVRNPATGTSLSLHSGYNDYFKEMWVSSDGEWLLSLTTQDGDHGLLSLWLLPEERLITQFQCEENEYKYGLDCDFSYSAKRGWLAVRDRDDTLHLYDLNARRPLLKMKSYYTFYFAKMNDSTFSFVPDGNSLRSNRIFTMDLRALLHHTYARWFTSDGGIHQDLRGVVLSADGELAATVHPDGLVKVWFTEEVGRLYRKFTHDEDVHALAFSPDGTLLVTASSEEENHNTVRVINVVSGKEMARIDTTLNVESIAISPDKRWMAAAGREYIKVWMLSHEDLVAEACKRLSRSLTEQEWTRLLPGEEPMPTCPSIGNDRK